MIWGSTIFVTTATLLFRASFNGKHVDVQVFRQLLHLQNPQNSSFNLLCAEYFVSADYSQYTDTRTHPFNGPLSGTTQVSRYQKGKTNLDFTEARDSEWHWHQLGHMQVCTSLQTDNHASTPSLSFLQTGCPSCHPTNSVKHWRHKHWPNRQMVQITPITPLRVTHTMM